MKDNKEKNARKKPPSGVQIISIVLYINAVLALNKGLGKLICGSAVKYSSLLQIIIIKPNWILHIIWNFIWCALFILTGKGLWKGIIFARYAVIAMSIVTIVMVVLISVLQPDAFFLSIVMQVTTIVIHGVIIYYLLNKNATKYFKNTEKTIE